MLSQRLNFEVFFSLCMTGSHQQAIGKQMMSAQRKGKRSITIRLCTLPAMTLTECDADVVITLNDSQNIDGILECSWRTDRLTFPARRHKETTQV